MRSAPGPALDEARLGEILVRLRNRHVIDAELLRKASHRRQPRAGSQFPGGDAVDNLLVQLQEERPAIAFRQRNSECTRLDHPPCMSLAVCHLTLLKTKPCMIFCITQNRHEQEKTARYTKEKMDNPPALSHVTARID
jgi:hypothetical protein